MSRFLAVVVVSAAVSHASAQGLDALKTAQNIAAKYKAEQYTFEGELLLLGQRGEAPSKLLSHARVSLAAAPGGKYFLRIEPEGRDAYSLISNGQKSWAFVPKLKQYTEEESAMVSQGDEDSGSGGSDSERDFSEYFARHVMPALSKLSDRMAAVDFHGDVEVKYEGRKQKWPLLRVASKADAERSQTLTQIAVDPESLNIGRMTWSVVTYEGTEKTIIQMTMDFKTFTVGPVPESTFTFEKPKNAKLVDAVPIPGQTGSFLLNHEAPDFELKTLDGEKVRLTDFRGKPVLLSFWASWCGPCRRELPELGALHDEYAKKGLVILGVNDEGKGTAKKFAEKIFLPFPTLDDSGEKVHRLYRVQAIPTLFLIDRDGKIVRFLRGGRETEALRAALAGAGL